MPANQWKPSDRTRREPAVLGQPVVDPAAWYPDQYRNNEDWLYRLDAREIGEIEKAIGATRDVPLMDITAERFPLPTLGRTLKDIQAELMRGRGFVLLRGLPAERMPREDVARAFWGLGAHFGRAISQNGKGHLLGHVKDLGEDYSRSRGYMTSAMMNFHTDQTDILSLCCLHPAKSGGAHRIASAVTVYNEMLKRRPDLMQEMMFRFYRSRGGEIPPGETEPWTRRATFSVTDGFFCAHGGNATIKKAQGLPGVPKLTAAQIEALKMYVDLATEFYLDIDFEIGDITYVQNYVTVHSRTAFEDFPEPERKRHLLRLWLNNGLRPIAADVRASCSGITVEGSVLQTPLEVA